MSGFHVAMEQLGFMRQRTVDDGTVWHLLPGTYDISGYYSPTQVYDLAVAAARSTGYPVARPPIHRACSRWHMLDLILIRHGSDSFRCW